MRERPHAAEPLAAIYYVSARNGWRASDASVLLSCFFGAGGGGGGGGGRGVGT